MIYLKYFLKGHQLQFYSLIDQKSIPTCVLIGHTHLQSLKFVDKMLNEHMRTEGGAAISSKSEFLEFQAEILDLEF